MDVDLEKIDNERISRFLKLRLGDQKWSVDEAKAKLTKIMKEAKDGRPQLVGLRNPVVMIGVEELEELLMGLQEPENWGEYFATAYDGAKDNVDIPLLRSGGRAKYALDVGLTEESVDTAEIDALDEEMEDDLELVAAYMDIGDRDAASIVMTEGRRYTFAKTIPGVQKHAKAISKTVRQKHFLKIHYKGSAVEGEIVDVGPGRLYVKMNKGVMGVAYTRAAEKEGFVKGRRIRACVVGTKPTKEGVALSLRDSKTGKLFDDVAGPDLGDAEAQ